MPLIRIDVVEGRRTPERLRLLADSVHEALVEKFAAPEADRLQIIHEHRPEHMILRDVGLGFERTEDVVVLQITQQGRGAAQKEALYARIAELFEQRGIAKSEDLVIGLIENTGADWSLGYGRAQFLQGDL